MVSVGSYLSKFICNIFLKTRAHYKKPFEISVTVESSKYRSVVHNEQAWTNLSYTKSIHRLGVVIVPVRVLVIVVTIKIRSE